MSYHAPLTDDELAEMQARCDAATPGPWESFHRMIVNESHCHKSDGEFIAHARTDIPRLLGDNKRLRAEVERLKADLDNERFAAEECARLESEERYR